MTAPTKAQQMAKRIAGETVLRVEGTVRENMEAAALAAIIETQEACARIAEEYQKGRGGNPYFNTAGINIAAAIREGPDQ